MSDNYVLTVSFKPNEDDELIKFLKTKRNKSMFIRELLFEYINGGFKRNSTVVENDDIMQVLLQLTTMVREIKEAEPLVKSYNLKNSSTRTEIDTYIEDSVVLNDVSQCTDKEEDIYSNADEFGEYTLSGENDNTINSLLSNMCAF